LLVLLLVLGACVSFHPAPLSPAHQAQELDARSLDDPGLYAYLETVAPDMLAAWPPPSWDLESLTLAAFYFQPDLDVARARWAVAQAATRTAGERPNPTLNVTPGYDTTTAVPSPWLPLALLDLPLETAGKRGYRIAEARQLSEASRLALAATAWQVRSRVRTVLVTLCAARDRASMLKEQLDLLQEIVNLEELQHEAGAVAGFVLRQDRVASDEARLAWRDAQRQRAHALVALAEAVGVPAHALDGVRITSQELGREPAATTLAEARRRALCERSDILSALAAYAASQSALQLEVAKQYPDLNLGPGYQYDQGDNKWTLGLTLTLPLFNRNRGPIAEAQARRQEMAAHFEALQITVLADVDRAMAAYDAARQQLAEADVLLADAQGQREVAEAMHAAGETARGELLAQRLRSSQTRLARREALAAVQQALAMMESTLQCSLSAPESSWERSPRAVASVKGAMEP